MSTLDWAKREVELACKKEAPNLKPGEWDYGCACYESALKAFESLINDNHSGMSWGITKNILIRLMDTQPLTPIEDVPEVWHEIRPGHYQCSRMFSFFKQVDESGNVTYSDINRTIAYDINTGIGWHNGYISDMVDRMFPLSMPYYPPKDPFEVYFERFTIGRGNSADEYRGLLYLITPEKERFEIDEYFYLVDGKEVSVTKEEFYKKKEKTNA